MEALRSREPHKARWRWQPGFHAGSREGSFSRTMVPDVVLACSGLGGPERRVIVLDAKYRINDGLNDALNSIHTYRDALVQKASGQTEGRASRCALAGSIATHSAQAPARNCV